MTKASTLLLFYCCLIALFLSVSGFLTSRTTGGLLYQFLFLPVTLYFVFAVVRNLRSETLDVNLSGKAPVLFIFLFIFLILAAVAVKNILAQKAQSREQLNSSQTTNKPNISDKDDVLIFPKEAE